MDVRPMTLGDVAAAVEAWRLSELDMRDRLQLPAIPWTPESVARAERRVAHFLDTDAGGAWVAELDDAVAGLAQAHRRDRLWVLSHLFVAPSAQNRGVGRALLERALTYGSPADPGMIISSPDPRAMRRYAMAGFVLHPTVVGWGRVDRAGLRRAPAVRAGGPEDLELTARVDRHQRGAAKTGELAILLDQGDRLLVVSDRGYAITRRSRVVAVAALDEDAATQLLTAGLAQGAGDVPSEVNRMTAAQNWAMDVALAAGLELHPHGAMFVRGRPGPLAPYLPDGALG